METRLFDYELPEERIAAHPPAERDGARLVVVERGGCRHETFRRFPELVPAGALVVLNDTRVRKARVIGERLETGGRVEILFTRRLEPAAPGAPETWAAIGRASKPLRPGLRVVAGSISIEVLRVEDGVLVVRATTTGGVEAALERDGHVPLPPYMRRADEASDVDRYQTVYAAHMGSAAAPTAGLHLTHDTLARLRSRGVCVEYVTLHVGLGTFRPVSVSDLDLHPMHAEEFDVSARLAAAVSDARSRGAPVIAVGTTVVRALESARDPDSPGLLRAGAGETSLLIQPGHRFGVVDALLTNFHAPRSTLLALVAAFAGRERVLAAYAEALSQGYRFLSYGDAMWLPEALS